MSTRARATALASLFVLAFSAACSRTPDAAPQPAATPVPAPAAAVEPGPVTSGWTATDGIETPESVFVDPASGFIFSSQVAGAPDGRDGNGRIVKLTGNGTVVSSTWVTGLNAPKGLRACNGTLWTADLDEVVGVEVATGMITSRVKVPNAGMLNDITCSDDGTVYVTDMGASRIITVKDGVASVFAEGDQLEWPNGLLVDGDHLVVGGWGKPAADFSTKVPGHLYTLDLKTRKKTLITPKPFANIDGLELDGRGGYILTDFLAGKIIHVSATGEIKDVQTFGPGTADLAFLADKNIAIVPHMNDNKLVAYDLSEALK